MPPYPAVLPYLGAQEKGGHPYGVEPLGNMFMRDKKRNCRGGGLGVLAVLDVSNCTRFAP